MMLAPGAHAATDTTVLVNRATGAAGVKGSAIGSTVSSDGRLVAFTSYGASLDPADTDSVPDVYVRDLHANTTLLASVSTSGARADAQAFGAIAGNGRYVVLSSEATNLDLDASAGGSHVYRRDLVTGVTAVVSRATGADGAVATGAQAAISDDGQRIAFRTAESLDPADTNGVSDVYVRDVPTDTTMLASRAPGGVAATGDDFFDRPALSSDGRFVAFSVSATPGDPNFSGPCDVYVRDLLANTTTLVSRSAAGARGNGPSRYPSISADGRYVAFGSSASNFDPADPDGGTDVFVRDMVANTTTLVSRVAGPNGIKPFGSGADDPAISADGRLVAFRHVGTPIHPDDRRRLTFGDPGDDILLRDLQTETLTLVSRASGASGAPANSISLFPRISGDGRVVTWSSFASNLHPDDTDGGMDIFARDPSPTPLAGPPPPPPAPPAVPPPPPPPSPPARPQPGCPLTGNAILGTVNDDVRNGTPGVDILFGMAGNDVLRGKAGRDCLYGDGGRDRLEGNAGSDRLFGGVAGDRLIGGAGADRLAGEAGADRLDGGPGNDRASGGSANDRLDGGAGDDRSGGDAGADRLIDANGRDVFDGGAGDDRIDARDATPAGRRVPDTVRCGAGSRDVAFADRRDLVALDCETIRRP